MFYIGHNPKVDKIFKIGKTKDFLNRLEQHQIFDPDFSYKFHSLSAFREAITKIKKKIEHFYEMLSPGSGWTVNGY